jgi:hypothetical protein
VRRCNVEGDERVKEYITKNKQHEAGFDSFMTGYILVALYYFFRSQTSFKNILADPNQYHNLIQPDQRIKWDVLQSINYLVYFKQQTLNLNTSQQSSLHIHHNPEHLTSTYYMTTKSILTG